MSSCAGEYRKTHLRGCRNVGDEYYGIHEDVNFGDLDVLAVGPAAAEVDNQFDLYWNSALAYPTS
jgi:putative cardiolipin synthase